VNYVTACDFHLLSTMYISGHGSYQISELQHVAYVLHDTGITRNNKINNLTVFHFLSKGIH